MYRHKTCPHCNRTLPLERFRLTGQKEPGRIKLCDVCFERRTNKPKPHFACFRCLRLLGFGYDRTAAHFGVTKKAVYEWFRRHGGRPSRPARPTHPSKPRRDYSRIDFDERWKAKDSSKLASYLGTCLWVFWKFGQRRKRMEPLVGCCREHLRNHIASQFHSGMSFENHGELWELDHVVPQCAYDLRDPAQRKLCYYYPNLKPMLKSAHRLKAFNCLLPVFFHPNARFIDPSKLRFARTPPFPVCLETFSCHT